VANIRTIRRRIRGVKSTAKITQAMQMIAASKMRRSQERSLAGRPYVDKIQQVIADLAALPEVGLVHPLLQERTVKKIAVVFITPDRGLCGGLVSSLNRTIGGFLLEQKVPVTIIAVGRKGRDFIRHSGAERCAEFIDIGDQPVLMDTSPISRLVIDGYISGEFDKVCLVYARFVSTMVQRTVVEQLLPVQPAGTAEAHNVEFQYEPGPAGVLGGLLPRFVEVQVYHAILESIASEQSARMVAMKNATDNANDLVEQLNLRYNKARQELITTEILEVIGGVEAQA
jgi:F-type H+-transporting ATPase subunit gamma